VCGFLEVSQLYTLDVSLSWESLCFQFFYRKIIADTCKGQSHNFTAKKTHRRVIFYSTFSEEKN
jgi:hypothetical protein